MKWLFTGMCTLLGNDILITTLSSFTNKQSYAIQEINLFETRSHITSEWNMIVFVTDISKTYAEVIIRVKAKRIISHLHVLLILLDVKHVNNKKYFIAVTFLYSTDVKFEHGLSLTNFIHHLKQRNIKD